MERLSDALCHEKQEPQSPRWHSAVLNDVYVGNSANMRLSHLSTDRIDLSNQMSLIKRRLGAPRAGLVPDLSELSHIV